MSYGANQRATYFWLASYADRILRGERPAALPVVQPEKFELTMAVLRDYYNAVGAVITRHEATLIQFAGDGVMVLVNAPIECENPAHRAVRITIDLQAAVQTLATDWFARGHAMGFGVGIAMGPATVGTVGYEGRLDYTAVGNVVNLASRLCASASDAQILVDPVLAERASHNFLLLSLGERTIKGYDQVLEVFAVAQSNITHASPPVRHLAGRRLVGGEAFVKAPDNLEASFI
jgi:adenylate cyclase